MDYTELIGFLAAIGTTISFLPQALKTIKTKSTKDISLSMYLLLCVGLALWLVYGFLIKSLPIIAANTLTLALGVMILFMKIKYG